MTDTIDAWLRDETGDQGTLAEAVLEFVRETLDTAEETVKWGQPCFEVANENCLYVSAQSGYVNLGFYEGAALDDPAGLLEGTGKAMRHVKVRSAEALEDPALTALVERASEHARA